MHGKKSMKGRVILFCLIPMVIIAIASIVTMYFKMKGIVTDQKALVDTIITSIVFVLIAGAAISAVVVSYFSKLIKSIRNVEEVVNRAAHGDLSCKIDRKIVSRRDEIGAISRGIESLTDSMSRVIGKLEETVGVLEKNAFNLESSAREVGTNVDNIASAVNDMAEGAVALADDTNNVAEKVDMIGRNIEKTSSAVTDLDANAVNMKKISNSGVDSAKELGVISEDVEKQVQAIVAQTQKTNDSTNQIQEVTNLIVSIASQTDLLALNASIEAARAGESGKGFAVVADEIKKLAEESNNSATKIAEIIQELKANSDESVTIMNEVCKIVAEQSEKIQETKQIFIQVNEGLETSVNDINGISKNTVHLEHRKDEVSSSIEHLSGISENNSASAQETAAATEEMTAMVQELVAQSELLKGLSDELREELSCFRIA